MKIMYFLGLLYAKIVFPRLFFFISSLDSPGSCVLYIDRKSSLKTSLACLSMLCTIFENYTQLLVL